MGQKIICEVGCGEKKVMANSIAIDVRKTSVVDIIADARFLPIKSESIDYLYSSHLIEHFSHREIKLVLIEWSRVIKPSGIFELRCPDFRVRALLFFISPTWKNVENIYGLQDYPENYHKCCFSYGLLKDMLNDLGISDIRRILDGYNGIHFMPNDLHIRGKKNTSNDLISNID